MHIPTDLNGRRQLQQRRLTGHNLLGRMNQRLDLQFREIHAPSGFLTPDCQQLLNNIINVNALGNGLE